jgi:hypothetical protein
VQRQINAFEELSGTLTRTAFIFARPCQTWCWPTGTAIRKKGAAKATDHRPHAWHSTNADELSVLELIQTGHSAYFCDSIMVVSESSSDLRSDKSA